MVEFSAEKGLDVDNTYFEHMSFHKYTGVERGQDGMEVNTMKDLALVKKNMLF